MPPSRHQRLPLLDELRGLGIALVVLYHGLYDWVYLWQRPFPPGLAPLQPLRIAMAGMLIAISGASSTVSRSNLRRGLQTLAAAACITLVTVVFLPSQAIWFGVLHLLGSCMVLYGLSAPLAGRFPPAARVVGGGLLLWLFWPAGQGYLALWGLGQVPLPGWLFTKWWLVPLGFYPPGFSSADYYPLLPWAFLFWAGSGIGQWLFACREPRLWQVHAPLLGWLGRHSLWIYLVHQPVLLLLGSLLPPA